VWTEASRGGKWGSVPLTGVNTLANNVLNILALLSRSRHYDWMRRMSHLDDECREYDSYWLICAIKDEWMNKWMSTKSSQLINLMFSPHAAHCSSSVVIATHARTLLIENQKSPLSLCISLSVPWSSCFGSFQPDLITPLHHFVTLSATPSLFAVSLKPGHHAVQSILFTVDCLSNSFHSYPTFCSSVSLLVPSDFVMFSSFRYIFVFWWPGYVCMYTFHFISQASRGHATLSQVNSC